MYDTFVFPLFVYVHTFVYNSKIKTEYPLYI